MFPFHLFPTIENINPLSICIPKMFLENTSHFSSFQQWIENASIKKKMKEIQPYNKFYPFRFSCFLTISIIFFDHSVS